MTTPKKAKTMTFEDIVAEADRREKAEVVRLAAMTPAEREAEEKSRIVASEEIEKILKQLRGPGFVEIRMPK